MENPKAEGVPPARARGQDAGAVGVSERAKVVGLALAGLLVSLWGGAWLIGVTPERSAYEFAAVMTTVLCCFGCGAVLAYEVGAFDD